MVASKKGMSAHQLHRMLGIAYRSAWFMAHRLRWAMTQEPLRSKLSGIVEVDETYIGGVVRGKGKGPHADMKASVVALVERNGRVRPIHVQKVTGATLHAAIHANVEKSADIMTDDAQAYSGLRPFFGSHETVNHSAKEYVRGNVHTNTAEGFFANLKRGIHGTFHHVSKGHLHRYLSEFEFRYNRRDISDGARAGDIVKATEGKRLMLRGSSR